MPIEILMPALSPTMTEGNLAKWNVKEGDKIKSGQVIAEIETDKATMEVEAVDAGTIGKIMITAGTENVKVNTLIALLLEDGEDKGALDSYAPKAVASVSAPVSGDRDKAADKKEAAAAPVATTPATNNQQPATSSSRTFASPLAKRIAADSGVPIAQVPGSGPHGRVVKADVEAFIASGGARGGVVRRNPVETTAIANNNMRKVIARRLTESKQTVPHFYLNLDIELDRLLDLRKQLNDAAEHAAKKQGKDVKPAYKLSVNDLVIKATAMAMKDVPAANASWTDAAILQYNNVDISVAVAIDGGLITPIVKNADQKDVVKISGEMKDLAARAKAGKLQPEEFQGGGFSISNLGMYGISHFAAIVNPPQGCILAVGAGAEKVVVKNGAMVVANVMTVTLSVDHRVVDGAVGAEFLQAFKRYIEAPALLLV
ncbi:MAG: pyruvate dehydrogenase complex dihydrolipoamide acetyltransferase [Alphaproteobacteria bacterium]|nr:pyruvate dehydrogenase complex dihydrolipoamide acetyltransferase [Alphaproteobacteria bacterium]